MNIPGIDLHGKSFGEMIRDLEVSGKLGHFKNCGLFQVKDSENNMYFATRDFWIEAGVNESPVFKKYLGASKQRIENIPDAIAFLKPILDRLTDELMEQIKVINTDLMLRKLFVLYEDTYAFYCKDRKTRMELANINLNSPEQTLENNRNITLTLLDGLSILLENCVAYQHEEKNEYCESIDLESADGLFDCDLLIKTYLYALVSQYYTILNLSKNAKQNYTYCSGIIVDSNNKVPVEGIIYHPLIYTSVMIAGNQNALVPKDEKAYFKQINTTPIGQGFQSMYGIGFLEVIAAFNMFEKSCKNGKATVASMGDLKNYLTCCTHGINPDRLIEHFSITKAELQLYISEKEPYIYRVGRNKYRLDIRPIILLNNGMAYISTATLSRAKNLWASYAINGGKPYTDVEMGHGDAVIDGFGKREKELGKQLVDLLYEKLEQHYPDAIFKEKDVKYDRIFGKKQDNYGDYDIVYYVGDELFLIESKYFSDSPTANLAIGDYNKIFKNGRYYEHCRARYDLVEAEPEKMKSFINAVGKVKAHYLFVSSKPLEIEFQDEDKIVTFLSVANFDRYIDGKLESEDGSVLRPIHEI